MLSHFEQGLVWLGKLRVLLLLMAGVNRLPSSLTTWMQREKPWLSLGPHHNGSYVSSTYCSRFGGGFSILKIPTIQKDHRQVLITDMKALMYADSTEDFRDKWENFQDSSPAMMYPNFFRYSIIFSLYYLTKFSFNFFIA